MDNGICFLKGGWVEGGLFFFFSSQLFISRGKA